MENHPLGRYFDSAALSIAHAPEVHAAITDFLAQGGTYGRAAYGRAVSSSRRVVQTRTLVAQLLHLRSASSVSFTLNATHALNTVIQGLPLKKGRVLISPLEHNAVVRPLHLLVRRRGLQVDMMPHEGNGRIDLDRLRDLHIEDYDLVVINHGSNVNGVIQPLETIREMLGETPILIDMSQTAGAIPIDMSRWGRGFVACSGHKSLAGPPGVGILGRLGEDTLEPMVYGGTGADSRRDDMPPDGPERYEAGTPNMLGIHALAAALEHPLQTEHTYHDFLDLLAEVGSLHDVEVLHGHGESYRGLELFSIRSRRLTPSDISQRLFHQFGIEVRSGLHCAPLAHRTLGTLEYGTVRISVSPGHRVEDFERLLQALKKILS